MVYGESGQFPLIIQVKTRILSFWYNLVNNNNCNKLSSTFYKFLHYNYSKPDGYKSPYLSFIESTLNGLGMSGLWANQPHMNKSLHWFKLKVKQRLQDQFIQSWMADIETNEIYTNYRLFKTIFQREDYLDTLSSSLMHSFIRFRTLNHRLPIQRDRFTGIPRSERLCTKCGDEDVGDEYHYIMNCSFFNSKRRELIPHRYWKYANTINFQSLLCTKNKRILTKLVYFIKFVLSQF